MKLTLSITLLIFSLNCFSQFFGGETHLLPFQNKNLRTNTQALRTASSAEVRLDSMEAKFINEAGDSVLSEKTWYSYNNKGQVSSIFFQEYDYETLEVDEEVIDSLFYNDKGVLSLQKKYENYGSGLNYYFSEKFIFDDNGLLKETQKDFNSGYSRREEYLYDIQGRKVKQTSYKRDSSEIEWQITTIRNSRYASEPNSVLYDPSDLLLWDPFNQEFREDFSNGKDSVDADFNVVLSYAGDLKTPNSSSLYSYKFDENNNMTDYYEYDYNVENKEWLNYFMFTNKINYDYNSPKTIETLRLVSNPYTSAWVIGFFGSHIISEQNFFVWSSMEETWEYTGRLKLYYSMNNVTIGLEKEKTELAATLYPSITSGKIYLESEAKDVSLEMFNTSGQRIYTSSNAVNTEIDIANQPDGLYIYKLISKEGTKSGRIIKK